MKMKLCAILMCCLMIAAMLPVTAFAEDTGVAINEANFPDANFRAVVSEFDTNSDSVLGDDEIRNVTKVIKKTKVIDNVDITFEGGKIYGLSGKNGCGKTMLMRLISGLIYPTEGEVVIDGKILGKDCSFPKSIGLLIENPAFLEE